MPHPTGGTIVTSRYRSAARPNHNGTDYRAAVGTKIVAVEGGKARPYYNATAGNAVEITHSDGSKAYYCHLSKQSVKAGATVKAGQQVGLSGNTGNSTGPHLHLGYILKSGAYANPENWVNRRIQAEDAAAKAKAAAEKKAKEAAAKKAKEAAAKKAKKNKAVSDLKKEQAILVAYGYPANLIDGVPGPKTTAARAAMDKAATGG